MMTTFVAQLVNEDKLHEAITKKRRNDPKACLKILDLCCGTGCISLLLAHLLKDSTSFEILGHDISQEAVSLAKANLDRMSLKKFGLNKKVFFHTRDIFEPDHHLSLRYDIIISNPPYVSSRGFNKEVTRSVRNWEPKQALVPPEELSQKWPDVALEDVFYRQLLEYRNCYVMILEVGSSLQAHRVIVMALELFGDTKFVELWRDMPFPRKRQWSVLGRKIPTRGTGRGRAVVIYDCSWAGEYPEQIKALDSLDVLVNVHKPNHPSNKNESVIL